MPARPAKSAPRPAAKASRLDRLEAVHPRDRAEWRAWLAEHHATSPGVWLIYFKKGAGLERLEYGDAVEEALCFGWIDSITRSIDATRYRQLFTPRKPKSTWSRSNKERVARLVEQGLMREAGLAVVELAKRNGAWASLDAVDALEVPPDLAAGLRRRGGATRNFEAFPVSARKALLFWVTSAKRPETRARRIAETVERAARNQWMPTK